MQRACEAMGIGVIAAIAAASDDAQDHEASAVGTGRRDAGPVVALSGDETRHERSVLASAAALPLGRDDRVVVHEIPSMDVVHVTVAVIVTPGLAVRLDWVDPELIAQIHV